jgi:hypothetical protein
MRKRQGFTLVEMLVASVLIIFILLILTQGFVKGLDAFRGLKAIGDMEEKLRTATTVLQEDLVRDHFEGRKRLSDVNFWHNGPPREGFFRLWQGSPSVQEGIDGDGVPSFIATNHYLHFTVKRRGNRREEFASARVPFDPNNLGNPANTFPPLLQGRPDGRFQDVTGVYSSQWYEVAYFLKDSGALASGNTKLYTLYRRQRLLVPDNARVNWQTPVPAGQLSTYAELSSYPKNAGQLYFNSPADITVPQRRFGMSQTLDGGIPTEADQSYPLIKNQNAALAGSDVLLSDVISFEVKPLVIWQGALANAQLAFVDFINLKELDVLTRPPVNSQFTGNGPRVFDTWSSLVDDTYDYSSWNNNTGSTAKNIPLYLRTVGTATQQIRVLALQITIRVWDNKTQQARQVTLVQDM